MGSDEATHEAINLLAWRMLASLGAPVNARPIESTHVDPECTFVLAAIGARADARMAEQALWFVREHQRVLSLTRIKTIVERLGPEGSEALGGFGAAARKLPDLRTWSSRLAPTPAAGWTTSIDLDRFERLGAGSAPERARRMPGGFLLRMRQALGPGARADALAFLIVRAQDSPLDDHWTTLREIEQRIGFGKRFLLDSLQDVARSGLIQHRRHGRAHEFAAMGGMLKELGPLPRSWIDWPQRISVLLRLRATLETIQHRRQLSTFMDAMHALPEFETQLHQIILDHPGTALPDEFVTWAEMTIESLTAIP